MSEAERIIGLYQRHAGAWDKDRSLGGLYEKPWLDRFLALLPPHPSILDIGCGAAVPTARYFIEQRCAVTGIDSSPALISICKQRFPDQTVPDQTFTGQRWFVADMRKLSLGRRFNGILAWDSFFHLCPEDQRAMFPIFRNHAAPNAALMFTSGDSYGEAIGNFQGEPLYHSSLDEAEYRALLSQSGFDVVGYVARDSSCGDHTIWLAQLGS
jgi:SAM-dependent methyltransferase